MEKSREKSAAKRFESPGNGSGVEEIFWAQRFVKSLIVE